MLFLFHLQNILSPIGLAMLVVSIVGHTENVNEAEIEILGLIGAAILTLGLICGYVSWRIRLSRK